MALLISLFLISLAGLAVMFSRKLALLKNQDAASLEKEHPPLEIPYVVEIRHLTVRKIKKYGYVGLVTVIRLYFRSTNILKAKDKKLKEKIENLHKHEIKNGSEKQEVNRFLKIISDYKHKIRKIKHQIQEEESL